MMDTYYEEIITEVKKLIVQKDYKEAYAILEDELRMPYIPAESEEKLIEYYNLCRSELQLNSVVRNYNEDDLNQLLEGSMEEQLMAVEVLKNSNIRKHLEMISLYLNKNIHPLIRSYVIEALMEQGVSEEMTMKQGELEITFIPCCIEEPMESDGAEEAVQLLRDWLENENPSYLMMCMDTLIKEVYLRLPFNIEEDEGILIASAVARYVFHANQDEEGLLALQKKKELAHEDSFELLLNKHDI